MLMGTLGEELNEHILQLKLSNTHFVRSRRERVSLEHFSMPRDWMASTSHLLQSRWAAGVAQPQSRSDIEERFVP